MLFVFKAGAPQGSEPLRCKPIKILYHKAGVGQEKMKFFTRTPRLAFQQHLVSGNFVKLSNALSG